ncbi:MAG: single-stranded DNA-binding protein [Treponema sp.]|nr:single-stranded DNA-binding protein [Treponema sp.]
MTDTNHVVIVGRLTRDVGSDERSFAYVSSGQARANVSIAVNRSRKNGDQWVDEANFFDVTIWGKTAENLKPYLLKGKQILVDGHLKQDRWEKDGQKFSKVTIVADNVQLLGGKSDNSGQQSGGFTPRFQNAAPAPAGDMSSSSGYDDGGFGGNDSGFPEDIPF